jgi:hypothetical protein
VVVEIADLRTSPDCGLLNVVDVATCGDEGSDSGAGVDDRIDRAGSAERMESCVGAEVRDDAIGRTAASEGGAEGTLGIPEQSLQFVCRRGDARLVEALEQMAAVPGVAGNEATHELVRGRRQARVGCVVGNVAEELLEARLRLGPCLGSVGAVRLVGQVMGDIAKDFSVAAQPTSGACLVLGRRERLAQRIEERPLAVIRRGDPFFCLASSTKLRMSAIQVLRAAERFALAEQRLTAERIPGQLQHRRALVELHTVAHEHDPTLLAQAAVQALVITPCQRGERHEVAEDAASMPLVQWQPTRVEVAGDLRERDATREVTFSDMQGVVEPVDALREHDAEVRWREEQRPLPRAGLPATSLVAANQFEPRVEPLHPATISLIDTERPFAVWTVRLQSRVDSGFAHGSVEGMALHPDRMRRVHVRAAAQHSRR